MIRKLSQTPEFNAIEISKQQEVLKYCFDKCSSSSKADVLIVMDASGSIGAPNFVKQVDFVKNLINSMEISENEQKVAIVIYSSNVGPVLSFTSNKQAVLNFINSYSYYGGGTYTNSALEQGVTEFTKNGR